MIQIKEFDKEEKCNEWLAKNKDLKIVDIKWGSALYLDCRYLVIYETSEAYPPVKE